MDVDEHACSWQNTSGKKASPFQKTSESSPLTMPVQKKQLKNPSMHEVLCIWKTEEYGVDHVAILIKI